MSITFGRPVVFKTAALAVFAAFTALFLAYVDLYLVFDEHVFRTVSRDFWQVYNFTYIAFFVVVVTVLATAVCLALVVSRGEASNIPNQRAVMGGLAVLALISVIAWWLF